VKTALSLTLLTFLVACGESRIKSVDEDVLEQAHTDRAAADLKQAQTALLGSWHECSDKPENASTRYEYTFTSDGQARLAQLNYEKPACAGEQTSEPDYLDATWKLVPVEDKEEFTLQIDWAAGKKLQSPYRLAGSTATLPRIFELKEQTELLNIDDKEQFITLEKVPVGDLEALQKKSEAMVMEYAKGLLRREGIWQSPCAKSQRTTLQFKVENDVRLTHSVKAYEDTKCEKLKEEQAPATTVNFTMVAVPDLDQKKIVLKGEKIKGSLKVSLGQVDQLELSDLIGGKDALTRYQHAAGEAP
jgi:hypothetical protein